MLNPSRDYADLTDTGTSATNGTPAPGRHNSRSPDKRSYADVGIRPR